MKIFGYSSDAQMAESRQPLSLAEITICASPSELRLIARFFEHCAIEMDRMGKVYDHIHLSDCEKSFESSPHLVVVRDTE